MQLVATTGALNWVHIAQTIGSRSPKQCRERYHQNLKPSLVHEPITAEEGAQIEYLVETMGKKWADIARRLHGRSDNAVKNWYNGSMNRRRRLEMQKKRSSPRGEPEVLDGRAPLRSMQHRPLTINSQAHFSNNHYVRPGQQSPVYSEQLSRAGSVEAPPSLVSDSQGSPYSRGQQSPSVELPPLAMPSAAGRRPSLPMVQVGQGSFYPESDQQARFAQEPKYSRQSYYHPYERPTRSRDGMDDRGMPLQPWGQPAPYRLGTQTAQVDSRPQSAAYGYPSSAPVDPRLAESHSRPVSAYQYQPAAYTDMQSRPATAYQPSQTTFVSRYEPRQYPAPSYPLERPQSQYEAPAAPKPAEKPANRMNIASLLA